MGEKESRSCDAYFLFFITHYASRGGCSNNGSYCGVFYVLTTSFSWDHWDFGAVLSQVHIMLNVAVFLEIKLSVVLLMFLLLIFILMLSGVLVLLY
jgi:hypothetical protein